MPIYSFEEAPAKVRELLARSRSEKRNPEEVHRELTHLGINPVTQMMYLRDGLGLSLEQAKRVVMSGCESDDAWIEEVNHAISEAMSDEATCPEKN